MLISLVGPDGAGKSTLSALLAERLGSTGYQVQRVDRWDIVDNPEYPAARFMRPDVPDTRLCVAEMPNPSRFLFLMWSIGLALLGRQKQEGAKIRVLDGYWMKHAASESVYGLDRRWVEAVVEGLPVPDVVLYLRLTPEQAWERKCDGDVVPYECGMDTSCSKESFLRHQYRILGVLDAWATEHGWEIVDAAAPLDQVLEDLTRRSQTALSPAGVGA